MSMINIIKQEKTFDKSLKQRLEFICELSHIIPTFINAFIYKKDKTNFLYTSSENTRMVNQRARSVN